MYMQINNKILIDLRKKRAWSQSELAEVTGLSLRTVQRIEKSGTASLESVKAFAAVFELAPESLQLTAATDEEVTDLSESSNSVIQARVRFRLSGQALQLSLALFLPASMVMLFMLFTKIPNVDWIHTTRLTLFSEILPQWISLIINLTIALLPLLVLSTIAGVCWDLYKRQGVSDFIRQMLKRPFPLKAMLSKLHTNSRRAAFLFKKPALFSVLLLVLTVSVIGFTMEPYQKANFKHFIAQILYASD
ncbi:helix-turn-helix transcriptional regulator [Rheinheimera sp. 1928-s]|uniref:helix-turn-helix transcriptional regulator n=1 Tax=Rheinheimera sp. 1928-s TaxID=3033803 RepID=UPI00261C6753|nr:helix-turn-helix transcriptional regulator [Rheinheimera sp. 1928-s]MDF3124280.1 helix-turn-helix transcriptional regulator [Rheinheimera sp. 1928-s]